MSPAAALARISAAGGAAIDPPVLLPANLIVELSGEAVRSRLCSFVDADGRESCLRPDMTTPIARMIATGEAARGRFQYHGPVFRLPAPGSGEPLEFAQAGFEWFGGGGAEEDAEAVALALEAAAAGGAQGCTARLGDVSLYVAVLDSLDLAPAWRARLMRAFFARGGPVAALSTGRPSDAQSGAHALSKALGDLSAEAAELAVEDMLAIAGVRLVGGRTASDIAARLRERSGQDAPGPAAARVLADFMSTVCPARECGRRLRAFARAHRLDLESAIARLEARISLLDGRAPAFWSSASFDAATGRRFEYYDGVVFELAPDAARDRPIATGGRYDGLLRRLNPAMDAPAIGAAIRIDRLGAAGARA